jgi:hypothetical protein
VNKQAIKTILKRIFRLNYLFYFFVSSIIFLYFPYKYEQKVLKAYINYVQKGADTVKQNREKFAVYVMNRLHNNMYAGMKESVSLELTYFENLLTAPLMQYGLSKDGACGGFTLSLGQILQQFDYKIRPIQMLVGKSYGGHIILEVKINDKWVVFDPLYNLVFKNPQGAIATFEEVGSNWEYYKKQTPAHYDTVYQYAGRRYTNWNRMPLFGTIAHKFVKLFNNKEDAEKFSFRSYMLNPRTYLFRTAVVITIILFLVIVIRNFIYYKRNKVKKAEEISN